MFVEQTINKIETLLRENANATRFYLKHTKNTLTIVFTYKAGNREIYLGQCMQKIAQWLARHFDTLLIFEE